MQEMFPSAALCLFGFVQFLGWMSGLLARCSVRSRHQAICHSFFMLTMFLVGASTTLAWAWGTKCWLISATTFAGMILLAICDFDHASRPVTI